MKRDFSMTAYENITRYINELEPRSFLGQVADFFSDIYYYTIHLFTKPTVETSQEKLETYCREVIDKKNLMIEQIHNVFVLANQADKDYAARGRRIYESGEQILGRLITLSSLAALEKLGDVSALDAMSVSFDTERADLTDEELIRYIQSVDSSSHQFYVALSNVSPTVLNMGTMDAIMIALFHHKDILLEELITTLDGEKVVDQVRQNILDGKQGYPSVDEIAKKVGLNAAQVRLILKNNKGSRYSSAAFWNKYDDVQQIVEETLHAVLNDNARYLELSEQLGVNAQTVQALINGTVDGYTVSLYKEAILKSLQDAAEKGKQTDVNLYPSGLQKIIGGYQKWYARQFTNAEGSDEAIKNFMKNDILSTKEATSFLKEYCGYETVTPQDIKSLQSYTKTLMDVNWLDDFLKNANKGVGYVASTVNTLFYLLDSYTQELEMLDTMIETNDGSPEYQIALQEVRQVYTSKAQTIMNEFAKAAIEQGIDEAEKLVPGLSAAEVTIGMVGEITGASEYTSAKQDVIIYSDICSDAVLSYSNALHYAKEQDYSAASLRNVRNSFEVMKYTLIEYYDAQIEYADGMKLDALEDTQYKAYLEYEKSKIEKLELGDSYTAISYDDYLKKYGSGGTGLTQGDF